MRICWNGCTPTWYGWVLLAILYLVIGSCITAIFEAVHEDEIGDGWNDTNGAAYIIPLFLWPAVLTVCFGYLLAKGPYHLTFNTYKRVIYWYKEREKWRMMNPNHNP